MPIAIETTTKTPKLPIAIGTRVRKIVAKILKVPMRGFWRMLKILRKLS